MIKLDLPIKENWSDIQSLSYVDTIVLNQRFKLVLPSLGMKLYVSTYFLTVSHNSVSSLSGNNDRD